MNKTTKSLTVSQLIKELEDLKKVYGDREVILSSDPEGNNFGTIEKDFSLTVDDELIILYPAVEFTDF